MEDRKAMEARQAKQALPPSDPEKEKKLFKLFKGMGIYSDNYAEEESKVKKVKDFLEGWFFSKPVNPNCVDERGIPFICYLLVNHSLWSYGAFHLPFPTASPKLQIELLELAIKKGVDVNKRRPDQDTPLMILLSSRTVSSTEGSRQVDINHLINIMNILHSGGVDLNLTNTDGFCVLWSAIQMFNEPMCEPLVECLISKGADINFISKDKFNYLHACVMFDKKMSLNY